MLLGNEVSMARKAREAILAIRIEESLSKERILELYLNEIYLGLQSYGVAAAAQSYFNKSLDELTLPEAAFLAALPKAPNNYNPFRFPDAARARRDWVIDRMADDHAITAEQAAAAKATPISPAPFRRPETVAGGDYFAEEVRRQLIDKFGADQTTQGGLVVRTSVDPALQAMADKTLRDGLMRYDQRRGGWRGAVSHVDAGPAAAHHLGHRPEPDCPAGRACWRNGGWAWCWRKPTARPSWACSTMPATPTNRACCRCSCPISAGRKPVRDGKLGRRSAEDVRRGAARRHRDGGSWFPPSPRRARPAAGRNACCCARFRRSRVRWSRSTPPPAGCLRCPAAGASR